jgi:hypothetical protein
VFPLAATGVSVGRITLQSADPDRLGVRQRFERVLATIDWTPPGVASHSILVLRRLTAPASGRTRLSFARCVSVELQHSASRAQRPWLQSDMSSAEAAIFADEAELVACLIRDWLRGSVAERWWWQTVLAHTGVEQWLRQHVLPLGEVFAPALSLLAPRTEVVPWLARLHESDARIAAGAVVRAFALPVTAAPSRVDPDVMHAEDDVFAEPAGDGAVASHHAAEAFARLVAIVPELQSVTLTPAQQRLLVLACVATRAPSWARTARFRTAMVALDRAQTRPATRLNSERIIVPTQPPPAQAADKGALETTGRESRDANPTPQADTAEAVRAALSRSSQTQPVDSATPLRQVASLDRIPASPQRERQPESVMREAADNSNTVRQNEAALPLSVLSHDETPEAIRESPAPAVERDDIDPTPIAPAARIETQYGGLFYLLNAWLATGLYSDFTAPRAENFVLSPWDLLALVGRAWFGEAFVIDSVWNTLADLAVRHPEIDPDRDHALPETWLDEHLHTLTNRLQSALGADSGTDIPAIVCHHRALIDVTVSAVHVHLWLSELPLEIRVAGLDRDPGWIPAAGRSLAFHFE